MFDESPQRQTPDSLMLRGFWYRALPSESVRRNRLEKAKEMLKTGNYSVKQVGYDIGFSNLSNFAKAFKKEFGILPKDIRKNK